MTIQLTIEEKAEAPKTEQPQSPSSPTHSTPSGRTIVNDPDDIHVLINKQYALPDGWAPSDLSSVGSYYL